MGDELGLEDTVDDRIALFCWPEIGNLQRLFSVDICVVVPWSLIPANHPGD